MDMIRLLLWLLALGALVIIADRILAGVKSTIRTIA